MKRILKRLRRKFPQPSTFIVMDQPSVDHDNFEQDDYAVETSRRADVRNPIDNQGMDVFMPDIYADAKVDVQPNLNALDQPTPDIEELDGFNSYDTAVLRTKQK